MLLLNSKDGVEHGIVVVVVVRRPQASVRIALAGADELFSAGLRVVGGGHNVSDFVPPLAEDAVDSPGEFAERHSGGGVDAGDASPFGDEGPEASITSLIVFSFSVSIRSIASPLIVSIV